MSPTGIKSNFKAPPLIEDSQIEKAYHLEHGTEIVMQKYPNDGTVSEEDYEENSDGEESELEKTQNVS